MTETLKIEPELQNLLPPLTAEELAQLEKNLLNGKATVTLIVWKERNVLLDGHNRYALCRKHRLPFEIDRVSLPSLEAAKRWLISYQLGRRNLAAEQASYLRGKQYEMEKSPRGGDRKSKRQNGALITKERLAQQHKVATKTIERDAKFARSVHAIAAAAGPEARNVILVRYTKLGRAEVQKLAEIARSQPQAAKNVLAQIKSATKPQEAKRVVHQAAKQLPTPEPTLKLTAPPTPGKSIEKVNLKGGTGYVTRNPGSEPVFNRTNEMVDWASWTWNPVTGCWHGCNYCYAREIANDKRMVDAYPKQFEPVFHESRLDAPANTPHPKVIERPEDRNVFVCSMADLFGKWVPDDWTFQVLDRVQKHSEWNFLFLSKFPQRLRPSATNSMDSRRTPGWAAR